MMHRLGIHAQPNTSLVTEMPERIDQCLADHPFAVIANDDRLRRKNARFSRSQQTSRRRAVKFGARFAIHSHELLLMRHDPSLDARRPIGVSMEAAAIHTLLG